MGQYSNSSAITGVTIIAGGSEQTPKNILVSYPFENGERVEAIGERRFPNITVVQDAGYFCGE
jgi:hypothetical protein